MPEGVHRPGERIGILAGRGGLPLEVADAVAADGGRVFIVGIAGEADPAIARYDHRWVAWGEIGAMLAALRAAGCRELVIIGGVRRPDLRQVRPDAGFLLVLPFVLRLMRGGDDSVLRRVTRFFEHSGFLVRGAHEVAPALVAGAGVLGERAPSPEERADAATGMALIAALGPADVGQACIVAAGRVLAIEAAEGTDGMLERLARTGGSPHGGGGVLVKAPKPGQELKVDLPTIGPRTVELAAAAGLGAIAVAAGEVLVAERGRVREIADASGLALFGAAALPAAGGTADADAHRIAAVRPLGGGAASARHLADADRALAVVRAAAAFGAGSGAVVVRGHVLAVGAGEGVEAVLGRSRRLRQWGDQDSRRRRGALAVGAGETAPEQLSEWVAGAGLAGIALADAALGPAERITLAATAARCGLFVTGEPPPRPAPAGATRPLRVFLVAGEHSGDALGARLMAALRARLGERVAFAGVGGELMAAQGLDSLFPLADVAVMGPLSILPRLPRIVARVNRTVAAALAASPDVVVVIDSPEFSHAIARRIRRRSPQVPIVDYVCPQVWAWRSGRAGRMRGYIDHVLALLPFEPDALARLGGPPSTYVGHPLIERLTALTALDPAPLADRLGLEAGRPVLVVLPGSRSSEVGRLMQPFGEALRVLAARGCRPEVVIPALPHVRPLITAAMERWPLRPRLVEGEEDKFRAFKLARAALAASGTVTLELALAGTPAVVAYRVDALAARLRFLVEVPTIVLANLVLGENVYPEFIQEDCTPEKLAAALAPLLGEGAERARQSAGLARIADKMRLASGTPSEAAAEVVLRYALGTRGERSG